MSLADRWAAESELYRNGAKDLLSYPQCETCRFFQKGNVLHCKKFSRQNKPLFVMFPEKECIHYEDIDPVRIVSHNSYEERLYGGILGFIIGDMAGVPVEFSNREERDKDPVRELRAYGTYHQHFGSWSDDSSLMLCLMDSVSHGFSLERLKNNMIAYYQDGGFTPRGEMFDIGNSTKKAIQNMIDGVDLSLCGGRGEEDNGNGSLMRILPLAFIADLNKPDELIRMVSDVSCMTHAHPRSVLACIFYTAFAAGLYAGTDILAAYENAVRFVKNHCSAYEKEFGAYRDVMSMKVVTLDRRRIRSSGYVVDTLEAVLWSLFNTASYTDAVFAAVNLGGDTDTIAALTGGLAGIIYGIGDIPDRWIQTILDKKQILRMTEEFIPFTQKY